MSAFGFKLEIIALFTVLLTFLRTKSLFRGRGSLLLYAHLVLYGSLAVMAVGGIRMFLYLCFKPKLFVEVFTQQRIIAIEPQLMLVYAIAFTITSLWFFWTLDGLSGLRKLPRNISNWLLIFYCLSYPLMIGINIGYIYDSWRSVASYAFCACTVTLSIGLCAVLFYRSKIVQEISGLTREGAFKPHSKELLH